MKREKFTILLAVVILAIGSVGCTMTNVKPRNKTTVPMPSTPAVPDILPDTVMPRNDNNVTPGTTTPNNNNNVTPGTTIPNNNNNTGTTMPNNTGTNKR